MRAAVVGATGYAGSELCRWLLDHPRIELAAVVSRKETGERLAKAVPALEGLTDLTFQQFDPRALDAMDLVFLALPHGAAKEYAEALESPRVLDLSADHRHADGWVYGLAEWAADRLRDARRIAVPGCFATAIEMALAPFAAAKAVRGPICVSAATGSTGAGVTPSPGTHHPERFANLKAYKVLAHQHAPEIRAALAAIGQEVALHFVPHSAPVDRGILATCFVPVDPGTDAKALVTAAYAGRPLVRMRAETPEIRHTRGTAFVDLSVHQEGGMAVVLSAVDNLGKGAATQAIQCANLALGLPVDAGLRRAAATP